ncbi:MAG: HNH nuclease family protein [Oxalobacter sp.]|uniref:YajD family HNH nuclease n=1 Tax=Oxalobacter vibrioformis TaxID=933080 RepID=UPI0016B6483A|nr:HNH nuclease family protein [Oxalobacter sp.]
MAIKKRNTAKLDQLVAGANKGAKLRAQGYRERALQIYPWICGRCAREFTHSNLQQLTVHHRDHNHDNNPPDGSNWELLCLYCHDNEHSRYLEADRHSASQQGKTPAQAATHNPFAALESLLKKQQEK